MSGHSFNVQSRFPTLPPWSLQEETGEDDLPIEDDDQGARGENEEDDPTGTAHMEAYCLHQ